MPQRAIQTASDLAEPFRVLVIDDDPGVRDYMEALVSRQGYEAHPVSSGGQLACLRCHNSVGHLH